VLGVAGLLIIPLIASIVAIVLGHVARLELKRDPFLKGNGYALMGVVLGWMGVALGLVLGLLVLVFWAGVE
jgi:Domain of unknown function (DUF4190)